MYGENNVLHSQLDADIRYVSIAPEMTATPTLLAPMQKTWLCKTKSTGTNVTTVVNEGLASNGKSATYRTSSLIFHHACVGDFPYDFSVVEVSSQITTPTKINQVSERFYTWAGIGTTSLSYTEHSNIYSSQTGKFPGLDFREKLTHSQILALRQGSFLVGSTTTVLHTMWQSRGIYSFNSQLAVVALEKFVGSHLNPVLYPIEEKPYGDLAMEATKQVNASSVNMLEFISDLKHPKKLVPKLRNLRNLKFKDLSDAYLSVKYGVLPTIDDLSTIWAAMHRVKPYIDKNGFSTYSAGFSASKDVDEVSYSLEQHLKVAISDEDNGFDAILSMLDTIGFLPTGENLYDLIPFSFVLDWFVDVGSFLERVDTHERISRLNIRYATMSRKTVASTYVHADVDAPFYGSLEQVQYHRWTTDHCPVPASFAAWSFQGFNHWLEAGALILSRSK
jgi:hypothetical protein